MAEYFENVTLKSKEIPTTEIVQGRHSKKTLRKKCKEFKINHNIDGFVSAVDSNNRYIVDYK